jgi:DNA-binding GntR family transcriptional regulator
MFASWEGRSLAVMAVPRNELPTATLPSPRDVPTRRSSGSQVSEYIRQLIFEGVLRPGDRVPQDAIAEALSVSRIPVREGLIALEREGWVTIELNRGAFVNALDADAVRDSYELLGLVYGFATRRAIARAGERLVDELTEIEKGLRAATDDPDAFGDLTFKFHSTIVEASHSPRIKVMLRSTTGLVSGNFFEQIPGSIGVERRGSSAIVRALRKGDVDKAVADYQAMLKRQGDLVVKVFKDRGLFAAPGKAVRRPA